MISVYLYYDIRFNFNSKTFIWKDIKLADRFGWTVAGYRLVWVRYFGTLLNIFKFYILFVKNLSKQAWMTNQRLFYSCQECHGTKRELEIFAKTREITYELIKGGDWANYGTRAYLWHGDSYINYTFQWTIKWTLSQFRVYLHCANKISSSCIKLAFPLSNDLANGNSKSINFAGLYNDQITKSFKRC